MKRSIHHLHLRFSVVFFGFVLFLLLSACERNSEPSAQCDQEVIISPELFKTAPSDQVYIKSAILSGDCLKISFSASGCDGKSWAVKLIDSEAIIKTLPAQRALRLSLENNEACLAVIGKEATFDVSKLRVQGDRVQLRIQDTNFNLLYVY